MPNITIDYTPNLAPDVIQLQLVDVIHQAAMDTQAFPQWGIRTMARVAEIAKVARGDADMGFIQIVVRIAPGRDQESRQRITKSLFDAASSALEPLFRKCRVGLQLEVQEFDAAVTLNRNTLDVG
jgi:5-carboxymethyl-2-hydroxymuconate isomerase